MTATGILVREFDQTLHVQVEGRATTPEGLALRRFAEERIAAGATAIWVDLCRCTYMDSTFVGTLMVLERAVERWGGELAAVSPSVQCTRVLYRMGLDGFFPLRSVEPAGGPAGEWTRLEPTLQDVSAFKAGTFEAHQELAGVPGRAREQFLPVVRAMEKELLAEKPNGSRNDPGSHPGSVKR
jgi:anti-sigma B factor antagonist